MSARSRTTVKTRGGLLWVGCVINGHSSADLRILRASACRKSFRRPVWGLCDLRKAKPRVSRPSLAQAENFRCRVIHLRLFYSQLASWFANTSNYREGTSIANAAITRVHHFAAPFVPYELELALIFFGDSLFFENFDRRHYHANWMAATYRIPRLS